MKKWIALVLVFLLAVMSVAAVAEVDFSSYTDAELREIRIQLNSEISKRGNNVETIKAVYAAFAEYMQELGHPVEYLNDFSESFVYVHDTQLNSEDICIVLMGGYQIMLTNDLTSDESYIRDCMVSIAMSVAQVEGIEIFSNEASTAMRSCAEYLPNGFFADELDWNWRNSYGYLWNIYSHNGTTVISVR